MVPGTVAMAGSAANHDSGPITSVSFVASATSNAPTITIPGSAAEDDLAILVDVADQSGGDVIPTGWTGAAVAVDSGPNLRVRVSYKILGAGEASASVTGMNAGSEGKVMLLFRGDVDISEVTVGAWDFSITASNPSSISIPASGQSSPLIVIGSAFGSSTPAFSTASPAFDATVNNGVNHRVGYKIYNGAPQNHTIDQDDTGIDNALAGGYFSVA